MYDAGPKPNQHRDNVKCPLGNLAELNYILTFSHDRLGWPPSLQETSTKSVLNWAIIVDLHEITLIVPAGKHDGQSIEAYHKYSSFQYHIHHYMNSEFYFLHKLRIRVGYEM